MKNKIPKIKPKTKAKNKTHTPNDQRHYRKSAGLWISNGLPT